ncbi:MAG: ZIP family metal transporter [Anaerolineales bacterium]|nr:ZIP family metal transporter [Anaerolineales bacterium]
MTNSLNETIIAATLTVLANGLGGLPFVFIRHLPDRFAQLGWAAAGGLMLSASVFNLIIPGLTHGGITPVAAGVLLGALLMIYTSWRLERNKLNLPGVSITGSRRIILVLVTMFIHSFPEGLALGVAYGSGEARLGILIAIAIAIHNIPEGTAVALPLRAEGESGWKCVLWAIFSGVPQLLAAVPAYLAVVNFRPLLPYAFGFAAGAMIFLVIEEMIPESRANERQRRSSAVAGMTGFLTMMVLQNVLEF